MNLSASKLRMRHPSFIYHAYRFELIKDSLYFRFFFEIEPNLIFHPEVKINGVAKRRLDKIGPEVLNNFAFHLGLMEIPSYWKTTCSPEIVVKAGTLDRYQQDWWKDLLLKGLGEFFYVNNLDFMGRDFVRIKSAGSNNLAVFEKKLNSKRYLLPIGGGKDSSVALGILAKSKKKTVPFILNPIEASRQIIRLNKFEKTVSAERIIDTKLLNLNKIGYLNGHTPFSAYLAFLSTVVSVLFDIKTTLVANSRSSNEGNTVYKSEEINHQYSKSFAFEEKFRDYAKKYLVSDFVFISLLRPLYELQIAKIFSNFPVYFPQFKSCNKNQKQNSWCHRCAKCLFVYSILYPFVDRKILTEDIFSQDLFEKKELLPVMKKFLQVFKVKPFDCVGTREETKVALQMCINKAKKRQKKLPLLLQTAVSEKLVKFQNEEKSRQNILNGWDEQNFLTKDLESLLKQAIRL